MISSQARVLVVDDGAVNRKLLERLLVQEGHIVATAVDGIQALSLLEQDPDAFDVILLDILMPGLDGYSVLAKLKEDEATRHVPVIMISAVEEVESVIRCIEEGATDYLTKPFNPLLLHARLSSSLSEKRLRDIEREYLKQVGALTDAAVSLEEGQFSSAQLESVKTREDALGQLARVFDTMAREVEAREQRLVQEVRELRIEVDHAKKASKVAEITGSDYFRGLRQQADEMREILDTE
jgi:CheY-like chemotaxis protein